MLKRPPEPPQGLSVLSKRERERVKAEYQAELDNPITAPPPTTEARQVYAWLIAGMSEADITEALQHHFPNSDHKRAMVDAFQFLHEIGNADPDAIRGWCLESARELYRRAMEANDGQGALAALKFIAQIGT